MRAEESSDRGDVLRRENGDETDQPHVYTQRIGNRKLWFSVAPNDPVAALLHEAIRAHERIHEVLCATCEIVAERPDAMDRMLVDVALDARSMEALRAYSEALATRDGPHGCFLSACVPLVDPKHVTASYRVARSLGALGRGRRSWLRSEEPSDGLSHEEARSRAFRVARNVYTILHDIIDVCTHLCGHRFVHDVTRDTMSRYVECVTPLVPDLVRCCRQYLEAGDETELAWMLAAHACSTIIYLKDVDARYGAAGREERHSKLECDLAALRKQVREATYVRDAGASDGGSDMRSLDALHENTRRNLGSMGVTNKKWLGLFNEMSGHLHKKLSAQAE
ncbi:hypothetical protein CYMTET_24672 [Cymbomonas tetramitiformis]|uniref:Uncharacterized protein n=1 Tax=Cymbomonas tetramitiformis TaxID=36881 RepID=A0AAE0FVX3_9CHLO|nr:hypothetical protein CYMTET_24672 [Cymbomonas tetramitiformis]